MIQQKKFSSFDYKREHEHLVAIFKLHDRLKLKYVINDPRLNFTMSSWHRKWILSEEQIDDLCRSLHLIRGEIENQLFLNKLRRQSRTPKDVQGILNCITTILDQINIQLPPIRDVVLLRARDISFKDIMDLHPLRSYPSMLDDYTHFLRRLHNTECFEYLRNKT